MVVLIVVLAVIVVIALGFVASYNRFVSQRNAVQNAWADVDTELKRRYDLVPNLVSTVQGYAAHERGVFEEVARARSVAQSAQGAAAASAAEGPFVAALGRLMAVAENYPELKANQNFLQLQATLSDTEDRIQASRRFYNANVQQFNTRIQAFPSNVVAGLFHFTAADFFHIDEAGSGPPWVSHRRWTSAGSPMRSTLRRQPPCRPPRPRMPHPRSSLHPVPDRRGQPGDRQLSAAPRILTLANGRAFATILPALC